MAASWRAGHGGEGDTGNETNKGRIDKRSAAAAATWTRILQGKEADPRARFVLKRFPGPRAAARGITRGRVVDRCTLTVLRRIFLSSLSPFSRTLSLSRFDQLSPLDVKMGSSRVWAIVAFELFTTRSMLRARLKRQRRVALLLLVLLL